MTFKISFHPKAKKEFDKLDGQIKRHIEAVFKKLSLNPDEFPHKPLGHQNNLDLSNCYKIKLKSQGYRVVYELHEQHCNILILAINKRDNHKVYVLANKRKTT